MKIAALLFVGGFLAAQAPRSGQTDPSIAARLQRLEDIEEIRFDFMGNSVVMDNFSLFALL